MQYFRQLKYIQEYSNNMSQKSKEKVTKCINKPYTKISWILILKDLI